MIYLKHDNKVVFVEEGSYIEGVDNYIYIHLKNETIKFEYDSTDLASEAFGHILKKLENYSSIRGISI